VAAVARDFGVGWATVMDAVIDYGTRLIKHPHRIEGVSAIGVDETAFLRANAAVEMQPRLTAYTELL
jgi:transposase